MQKDNKHMHVIRHVTVIEEQVLLIKLSVNTDL